MTDKVKKTKKVQRISSFVEGSRQSGNIWTEYWFKLEGITELFRVQPNIHPSIALTKEGDTVTVQYLPDNNRSTVFLHEHYMFKNDSLATLDQTDRNIEDLGEIELTPELDEKINRMTAQADAEIDAQEAQRKQNK